MDTEEKKYLGRDATEKLIQNVKESVSNGIAEAKEYSDTVEQNAKKYTDSSALTWGSF